MHIAKSWGVYPQEVHVAKSLPRDPHRWGGTKRHLVFEKHPTLKATHGRTFCNRHADRRLCSGLSTLAKLLANPGSKYVRLTSIDRL
jgi:hypothetical protein